MDFIKKTVCLEEARTRTQGLMPYYAFGEGYSQHKPYYVSVCNNCEYSGETFDKCPRCGSTDISVKPVCKSIGSLDLVVASGDNGNWGQFVANPCFLSLCGKTYETMLHKYYSLLNIVRNGIKLRKVDTKDNRIIYTEDVGAFETNDGCFSGGTEPDSLYVYAAYDSELFYSVDNESLRDETKRIYIPFDITQINTAHTFIVLVKDYDSFVKMSSYFDDVDYKDADIPGLDDIDFGNDEHLKWATYCQIVDAYIGRLNVPARIYNKHIKVPKSMSYADVKSYYEWLKNYQSLSADCCNMRLWDDMGGEDMMGFLSGQTDNYNQILKALNEIEYGVPYLEVPVLLIQNTTDIGVLTNVDGVEYVADMPSSSDTGEYRPHGVGSPKGFTIDEIIMSPSASVYPTQEEYEASASSYAYGPIETESLLKTLRSRKKYTDDKNNVLPGLFQSYSDADPSGKMFRCIKQSDEVFERLIVVSSETTYYVDNVPHKMCTVKYGYEVAEDIPDKDALRSVIETRKEQYPEIFGDDNYDGHFYTSEPTPSDSRTFHDTDYDTDQAYHDAINAFIETLSGKIDTDYFLRNPISVANAVWRMETEDVPTDVSAYTNGDGMQSEDLHYPESDIREPYGKKYRTITTEAAGIRIAETEEEENGEKQPFMEHYYFKVKYDNSSGSPMTIPYEVGNTANVYLVSSGEGSNDFLYRGDFIVSAETIESGDVSYFETKYVIGGYFYGDSAGTYVGRAFGGDVYYEKHVLDLVHSATTALDGVDNVPIWSQYIDFESDAKEFYSTRYNLYRTGNTANIIELGTGEVWNIDFATDSLTPYDAHLTKEDYLINFSLPPKVDVNVTIDRGGVSAFEKHYKLAECNTMQDLMNYHNGEFFEN